MYCLIYIVFKGQQKEYDGIFDGIF